MISTEFQLAPAQPLVQAPAEFAVQNKAESAKTNSLGKGAVWEAERIVSRWIKGGAKDDRLFGDAKANRIQGNKGSDLVRGRGGNDVILGGAGVDRLFGEGGNDQLSGDAGNDFLFGGGGRDKLDGGVGRDTLTGGGGSDHFILGVGMGGATPDLADLITDFQNGIDVMVLKGGLSFSQLNIAAGTGQFAGSTIVTSQQNNEILAVLQGINPSAIGSEDFVSSSATSPTAPASPTSPTSRTASTTTTAAGTFGFSVANYSVNENSTTATITVTRSGGSTGTASINFATTTGGTATAGTDYVTTSGTLSFASGQTSRTFTVSLRDDQTRESNETVRLTLSNPVGAALGTQNNATLTIVDNDATALTTSPLVSIGSSNIKFTPSDSQATIASRGAAKITIGTQTIYIGTQQVTSINQNPIIRSFDSRNSANNWTRTDYEVTGADGRGYGLFWDGTNLYGVFSVDGTQGTPSQDFRRVSSTATQAWLRSYGMGGGPKIGVLARLNPATGVMTNAAYISARTSSGRSNSLSIKGLSVNASGNLVVRANSWFAPRRPDGTAMTQTTTGSSPFDYTLEITRDLRTVVRTSAVGWR